MTTPLGEAIYNYGIDYIGNAVFNDIMYSTPGSSKTSYLRGSVSSMSKSGSSRSKRTRQSIYTSIPERKVRAVTQTIVCRDRDKEGANEYQHNESSKRVSVPLPYKVIEQMISPTWSEKVTQVPFAIDVGANTENIQEFLLMSRNDVLARLKKAGQVSPFQALLEANATMTTTAQLTTPSAQVQQLIKFEGGRYRFRFINTCSNAIHFEFRQFKGATASLQVGHKASTKSPLFLWSTDQANTAEFGDLPFPAQISGQNPENTARLAGWTISNSTNVVALEANATISTLTYGGLINYATLPAMKRPQRSSPLLHSQYDKIAASKIVLKPGDTFVYDIRINPFTVDGAFGYNQAIDSLIQYYSRVLWIFARGEFNVDNLDKSKMAPGPCSYSCVLETEFNWRAVPRFKVNNFYEQSNNTATLGPFADLTTATTMATDDIHEELYNTTTTAV